MEERKIDEKTLEKFNGVWDSKLVLQYLIVLYKLDSKRGSQYLIPNVPIDESSNLTWEFRRLLSVLKAYGIIEGNIEDHYNYKIPIFSLVQDEMSGERNNKFLDLCNEYFDKKTINIYRERSLLLGPFACMSNFKELFTFSNHLDQIRRWHWGFIEGSAGFAMSIISAIYRKDIDKIDEKVKEMMALLMDEDFDKTFSERELILHYDYPLITDEEINYMATHWD